MNDVETLKTLVQTLKPEDQLAFRAWFHDEYELKNADVELSPEWKEELSRRMDLIRDGKDETRPADQVLSEFASRFNIED